MSQAAERRSMVELLPAYSLMSIPQLAKHWGCSQDVAREMVDSGKVPSIRIGGRRMIDPMDVAAYELAEREGITAAELWEKHGDATIDLMKKHVSRIRRLVA